MTEDDGTWVFRDPHKPPLLLTTNSIRREYARVVTDQIMGMIEAAGVLKMEHFPPGDLLLDLDSFSRKQGWMK